MQNIRPVLYINPTVLEDQPIDQLSMIANSDDFRRQVAGLLFAVAKQSSDDDERTDPDVRAIIIDAAYKIMALDAVNFDATVTGSTDGANHFTVFHDPVNAGHYTWQLQLSPVVPSGASITGVTITETVPTDPTTPTASFNTTTGVLTLRVHRARQITGVTYSVLSPGSDPTVSMSDPDSNGDYTLHFGLAAGAAGGGSGSDSDVQYYNDITNVTGSFSSSVTVPTITITDVIPGIGDTGRHAQIGITLPPYPSVPTIPTFAADVTDLPDGSPANLVYHPTTHTYELQRPGHAFIPDPSNTSATICDAVETIAAYVNAKFIDSQNQAEANISAGLSFVDSIIALIGVIPLVTGPTDAIVTFLVGSNATSSTAVTSNNNTEFKVYCAEKLYCIMNTANTKVYTADIQAAWITDIFACPTSITPTIFSLLYARFVAILPVQAVQLAEKFAATGHDCAAYDCGGGGSNFLVWDVVNQGNSTNAFSYMINWQSGQGSVSVAHDHSGNPSAQLVAIATEFTPTTELTEIGIDVYIRNVTAQTSVTVTIQYGFQNNLQQKVFTNSDLSNGNNHLVWSGLTYNLGGNPNNQTIAINVGAISQDLDTAAAGQFVIGDITAQGTGPAPVITY